MLLPVDAVLQVYVVAPVAVKVVLCPLQIKVLPEIAKEGFTVTVFTALPLHPPEFPVSVYVVVTVGDTVMLVLVEPVLQV